MPPTDRLDRGKLLVLAVVLLFAPLVVLGVTMAVLMMTHSLVFGNLSALALVELYLLDLVLLAGFAYVLYRLLFAWVDERYVPDDLDRTEAPGRRGPLSYRARTFCLMTSPS